MLNALFTYPETLAHWIIILPFMSFVFIVLKLTVNIDRTVSKPKASTDKPVVGKLPRRGWTSFLPGLLLLLFAFVLLVFKSGTLSLAMVLSTLSYLLNSPADFLFDLRYWLIFGIPIIFIVAFPVNSRRWIQKAAPYISVGAMALGAVIATFLWMKTIRFGLPADATDPNLWKEPFYYTWFALGEWKVNIGVNLDGFSIFAVWMVTVVAGCIQWFSIGYMWDDEYGRKHYARYFAEHSLFATGMLLVVLSNNILTFLFGWEVMGLCSYLLIGFFSFKPSANAAQVKAFITTRIGDVGFMLGIFLVGLMYTYTGNPISFEFDSIREIVGKYDWWAVDLGWLPTAAALLIFLGAVGKSAQFPLHVWLPDAMEGPTPVSALIHAATMVAAGVFLVARFFWLFELSTTAMLTVAIIGAITAFGAATIAVVQYDIKRILAYSTISQLGYMMIGLGVGSVSAGVFHLLTHAYFKALLFLGSGAVIYGCRHIQDIRYMGGLSKKMPITYFTFLAGTLALAGIFPFAGFWSKDEILASAFNLARNGYTRITEFGGVQVIEPHPALYLIWILGIAGAFLTAFYMFRLISYTFLGGPKKDYAYRGKQSPDYGHHAQGEKDTEIYKAWDVPPGPFDEEEHQHGPVSPREVPKSMWIPLVILAVFGTVYGFTGTPFFGEKGNLIASYLNYGHAHYPEVDGLLIGLMVFSLAVALGGVVYGLYINGTVAGIATKEKWKARFPGLYRAVYNKYYFDEFYEEYLIQPVLMLCQFARIIDTYIVDGIVNAVGWLTYQFALLHGWFDNAVVDGIVNGVAWIVNYFSQFLKPIQSGFVQNYMMVIVVFVLFYLLTLFLT